MLRILFRRVCDAARPSGPGGIADAAKSGFSGRL
jgi:hypothetical protein